MILSVNKQDMTARVRLYRGTVGREEKLHRLSWWSMNPDMAKSYGNTVQTAIFNLPIKEVKDWFGEEVVVFAPNHCFIRGMNGIIDSDVYVPLETTFSMSCRDDVMFSIGQIEHVHFAIGSDYYEGMEVVSCAV